MISYIISCSARFQMEPTFKSSHRDWQAPPVTACRRCRWPGPGPGPGRLLAATRRRTEPGIRNLHHLDENSCIGTTRDIQVCTSMAMSYWYLQVYTMLYQTRNFYTGINRYKYIKYHCIDDFSWRSQWRTLLPGWYMEVCTCHVMCNISWCPKPELKNPVFRMCWTRTNMVHTYTYKYMLVHTHTKVTTTFHFKSGLNCLATPASFPTTLELSLAWSFLPLSSLLDCQTTQAGLAAPKLPQPRVDFIDLAAPTTPASWGFIVGLFHQTLIRVYTRTTPTVYT
jgi:hypothetical protein